MFEDGCAANKKPLFNRRVVFCWFNQVIVLIIVTVLLTRLSSFMRPISDEPLVMIAVG